MKAVVAAMELSMPSEPFSGEEYRRKAFKTKSSSLSSSPGSCSMPVGRHCTCLYIAFLSLSMDKGGIVKPSNIGTGLGREDGGERDGRRMGGDGAGEIDEDGGERECRRIGGDGAAEGRCI